MTVKGPRSRRIALGSGSEFDLIRKVTDGLPAGRAVRVGPGDDAAVLDDDWVATCDLAIEDVHFRRAWLAPAEIGGRAVRAALSDLAGMAADPVAVLISLAGPERDLADGTLEAMGRGARDTAAALGAELAGGDVTRSPGPLVIDVIALGRAVAPVLRSGARVGDTLWVTGPLGGAAAAVQLLEHGTRPDPDLQSAFACPEPRLAAARGLHASGLVSALIDLSDGLAGDAAHLAASAGVGVEIDAAAVPVHEGACKALGEGEALQLALSGGEDYELLLAAGAGFEAKAVELSARLGVGLTRVGIVVEGEGVRVRDAQGHRSPAPGGFDHFIRQPGRGGS